MTEWTEFEVLYCIKLMFNDHIVYKASEDDLRESKSTEKFLQFMFDKSERINEFYETFDDFRRDLERTFNCMPEFYRYGRDKPGVDIAYSISGISVPVYQDECDHTFISKNDFTVLFLYLFDGMQLTSLSGNMFRYWMNFFIHSKFKNLKNTYEFLPFSISESMENSARTMTCDQQFKGVIREKDFCNLRRYFLEEHYQEFYEKFKEYSQKKPIARNQLEYKKIYDDLVGEIEKVLKIHENFKETFEPSKNPLPIIRCFFWSFPKSEEVYYRFYFEKEVLNAIKYLRNDSDSKFESDAETEEERKLGIVHLMNEETFFEILETHKILKTELHIIMQPIHKNKNEFTVPIISSFGTFCKLATDAFEEVLLYLIRNLQLFQNMQDGDFEKIIRWIEQNTADFLFKSDKFYTIDLWRIEEIMEKANNDLRILKKSDIFKIPTKSSYKKSEILDFIQQSIKPSNVIMEDSEDLYGFIKHEKMYKKHDIYRFLYIYLKNKILYALNGSQKVAFCQQFEFRKVIEISQEMLQNEEKNQLMDEVVKKVLNLVNFTLAHFKTGETQPITKFEKLLETPNFRKHFDEEEWGYLKYIIFKDLEKTRELFKRLEHLYEFEEYEGELLFSKREKFIGDSESIRLMEMEEMDRISEKTKLENSKLRSILDAIQGQLKELRISKEDEKKLHQEEVRQLQKANQKIKEDYQKYEEEYAEDMSVRFEQRLKLCVSELTRKNNDLKNELNLVKKSSIEVEKKLEKKESDLVSAEKSKHNLENQLESAKNSKIEIEKKLENTQKGLVTTEKSNENLEDQLKSAKNLQREIAKKLEKAENDLASAEASKKNLENQLKLAKNEKNAIENQLKNVENNLVLAETSKKNVENELVLPETSKLAKENKKLRRQLLKLKKLETWFENGIEQMNLVSKNHQKLKNYERILKITHEEIFSNLNKLLQKFPNNTEIFRARNQIFKKEDFEEKLELLRGQVWRIQENPEGEFEEIPFIQLMEKYEQWIEEYL